LATDIEIQITTQTPTLGSDKASMTVGARKLQDILRSLPESAEVSLALDDKRLQLKGRQEPLQPPNPAGRRLSAHGNQ
jgi:DNA polymerase-3 subunit beta